MSNDMSLFFADAIEQVEAVPFVVSDRIKDKEKKPVEWLLRPISEDQNDVIRKSATRKNKGKNGMQLPEVDSSEYVAKLVAACVVYPNLNDAELQRSYGVRGADVVVRKMLLSGEYAALCEKVQEINGFDKDVNELADEVKN